MSIRMNAVCRVCTAVNSIQNDATHFDCRECKATNYPWAVLRAVASTPMFKAMCAVAEVQADTAMVLLEHGGCVDDEEGLHVPVDKLLQAAAQQVQREGKTMLVQWTDDEGHAHVVSMAVVQPDEKKSTYQQLREAALKKLPCDHEAAVTLLTEARQWSDRHD